MLLYKCKHIHPEPSNSENINASSPEEAAQIFHMQFPYGVRVRDGSGVRFSIIQVNNQKFISRIFILGIGRKGGIRVPPKFPYVDTINEAAKILNVPIETLTREDDWIGAQQDWE
jgi:hypothetical protein